MKSTAILAICWRVLIAATTRTFFQPDEYFQSLEVAHNAVFGYGHLTWEWLATPPIRSIVYPSLFIPVYWVLKQTGLDDGPLLIIAPKVVQGVFASMTDIGVYVLTYKTFGKRYARAALFLSLTSFFNILSLGRTLSNSLEASLTTVALCYWPWHELRPKQVFIALSLAAFACMVRATNAIIWVFLILELLWRVRLRRRDAMILIFAGSLVGSLACCTLFLVDSLYFGRRTFTPLNFLQTNLTSVSLFYGQNPWHYYVTQALPILCTTSLPFFVIGAWMTLKSGPPPAKVLLSLTIWTIGVYTLLGHKEWRFIHPILPIIHVISAKGVVDLYYQTGVTSKARSVRPKTALARLPIRQIHLAFLLLSFLPGIYVMYFHSRAQISVMSYLRGLAGDGRLKTVGFLMPCHSTPAHAYLHRPRLAEEGRMWAIGCEPPLNTQPLSKYEDQTDAFYKSPKDYMDMHFPKAVDPTFPPSPLAATRPGMLPPPNNQWRHHWPSHIVLFGALLEPEVLERLQRLGYAEDWSGQNGLEEDWRRRGGVRVWAWRPPLGV